MSERHCFKPGDVVTRASAVSPENPKLSRDGDIMLVVDYVPKLGLIKLEGETFYRQSKKFVLYTPDLDDES